MRSLFDDVITALTNGEYSFSVSVRKPHDASPKTYPMLVVTEIDNLPVNFASVHGEDRTLVSYQVDIYTMDCLDNASTLLNKYEAGQTLAAEVTDVLEKSFKMVRRSILPVDFTSDVYRHVWRGSCVLDSYGYTYRQ